MLSYYAFNGSFRVALARSDQMQGYLNQGYTIWEIPETGEPIQIADPDKGFYSEPPVFPKSHTTEPQSDAELRRALSVLLDA